MSAMPTCGQALSDRPASLDTSLDRLFDRLVAELRAAGKRLAAGRPAR